MSQTVAAEAHLARQEVHLGDCGHVSVQAREFHTRCTIAEGGSRVESSRYRLRCSSLLLLQDHCDRSQPGLPIWEPSKFRWVPFPEAALSGTPKSSSSSECRLHSAPVSHPMA